MNEKVYPELVLRPDRGFLGTFAEDDGEDEFALLFDFGGRDYVVILTEEQRVKLTDALNKWNLKEVLGDNK